MTPAKDKQKLLSAALIAARAAEQVEQAHMQMTRSMMRISDMLERDGWQQGVLSTSSAEMLARDAVSLNHPAGLIDPSRYLVAQELPGHCYRVVGRFLDLASAVELVRDGDEFGVPYELFRRVYDGFDVAVGSTVAGGYLHQCCDHLDDTGTVVLRGADR